MRVMLVEDCVADQNMFMAMAKQADPEMQVVCFSLLVNAMEDADQYDALFVDLTLGDASAEKVLEFIRDCRRRKPTVIVSADDSPQRIADAGHLGAGYLVKGKFTPQQILVEIHRQAGQIRKRIEIETMFAELTAFLKKLEQAASRLELEPRATSA